MIKELMVTAISCYSHFFIEYLFILMYNKIEEVGVYYGTNQFMS